MQWITMRHILQSFVKEKDPFIIEMEQYAAEHHVPIMDSGGIETVY